MKILLTGKTGQIGFELEQSLRSIAEVIAPNRNQMDLSNLSQVREVIRMVRPDLIINPAAFTDVDRAESEVALAMRVNGEAPGVMAEAAKELGAWMIQYSTDYVFNGMKDAPYDENDVADPINVYGRSKLAGELAIQSVGIPHLILRTSWVYSLRGGNFLTTVLRLASEKEELRFVVDQRGSPTCSRTVADTTTKILQQLMEGRTDHTSDILGERSGVYHLAGIGHATRYEFAEAIIADLPITNRLVITPILSTEIPATAKRPRNSALHCKKIQREFCALPTWEDALQNFQVNG